MEEDSKGQQSVFDFAPHDHKTMFGGQVVKGQKVHWHPGSNFIIQPQKLNQADIQASHNCSGQYEYFKDCKCLSTPDCHKMMWLCTVCKVFQLCTRCMEASTKIYEKMLEENDQKLLIARIREAYRRCLALAQDKDHILEDDEAFFDEQFKKVKQLAQDKIKAKHKYLVIGLTKSGKSTLINRLIGKKILSTHDLMYSSTNIWQVYFHQDRNFIVQVRHGRNWDDKSRGKEEVFVFQNQQEIPNLQALCNDSRIEKGQIKVPSIENQKNLKFVEIPGLDNSFSAFYCQDYIDAKKGTGIPIFVINLAQGGLLSSTNLLQTLRLFDNIYDCRIIVVFTRFKSYRDDVWTMLSCNDHRFDYRDQKDQDQRVNEKLLSLINLQMKPFKERLFEVDFFIFDENVENCWTNADISRILDEEPQEKGFYLISEAPKEIKALIEKQTERQSQNSQYFQRCINKASVRLLQKFGDSNDELSSESIDDESLTGHINPTDEANFEQNNIRYNQINKAWKKLRSEVFIEISEFLDEVFNKKLIFKAINQASQHFDEIEQFEISNHQVIPFILNILINALERFKFIKSQDFTVFQNYLKKDFVNQILAYLETCVKLNFQTKKFKNTLLSMNLIQLESLNFSKNETELLKKLAIKTIAEESSNLIISWCKNNQQESNDCQKMIKFIEKYDHEEQIKKQKIRECLEFLKQAASNPNFDNHSTIDINEKEEISCEQDHQQIIFNYDQKKPRSSLTDHNLKKKY